MVILPWPMAPYPFLFATEMSKTLPFYPPLLSFLPSPRFPRYRRMTSIFLTCKVLGRALLPPRAPQVLRKRTISKRILMKSKSWMTTNHRRMFSPLWRPLRLGFLMSRNGQTCYLMRARLLIIKTSVQAGIISLTSSAGTSLISSSPVCPSNTSKTPSFQPPTKPFKCQAMTSLPSGNSFAGWDWRLL